MFLVMPVWWAGLVHILLPTAMARTDVRATYGGFDIGIGVFLGICAIKGDWTPPGVLALALAAGGYGGGRLVGILIERTASPLMSLFVVLEIGTAVASFYLYRRLSGPAA